MLCRTFYSQNSLKTKILGIMIESAGKQFHETTTDRKWAVGTDLSSKALRSEDWKGNDVLGQLLEATRDTLIATLGGGSTMPPPPPASLWDRQT